MTQAKEQTFDIIEQLSKDNIFYVHVYETGGHNADLENCLKHVTVDELKQKPYDAYDECIEVQENYNNLNYFEIQPRDLSEKYNQFCDYMIEKLKELQPHTMLHFDCDGFDTCDVYVVSKK